MTNRGEKMQKTILVYDNHDKDCDTFLQLASDDYDISTITTNEEAMSLLQTGISQISMVIIKLNHPYNICFHFIQELKTLPGNEIPILVAAEAIEYDTEVRLLELGVTDFILKPYHFPMIRTRISNLIMMFENEQFRHLSEMDPLTHIYNREAFYKKSTELIHQNPNINFDILCIDIDRFKVINDLYGSQEGDNVLICVANILTKFFSSDSCICSRLSADNFAVCIPHVDQYEDTLIHIFDEELKAYPLNISIVVRCGFYHIHTMSVPISGMCDRANMAIASIKGNYLRRYAIYDESLRSIMLKDQEIINEMNDALKSNQFQVYYQPKINMLKNRIIGTEALVRWMHPTKGMISPGVFIPIFEKNGFISYMDSFIWEQVCKDLKKWIDLGYNPCPVSINVSRIELYDEKLCGNLLELIKKYNVPIHLLQLEITETAYTENPTQLINIINNLRQNGFTILMDDFGSGYSSLNTLKDVPVDILKLDLKFLYDIDSNTKSHYILKSIVQMARRLKLSVIAEGVETNQQADFLKSIGCIRAQGFLYAKPVPKEELVTLLGGSFLHYEDCPEEIDSLINIDDILSQIHEEGEIEWYRSAFIQLNAVICEYDVDMDTLLIYDKPSTPNGKDLCKIEIPNFTSVLNAGKYIHPSDVDEYKKLLSLEANSVKVRVDDVHRVNGYHWYEIHSRVVKDDDDRPRTIELVCRDIMDEKHNLMLVRSFHVLEQSSDIAHALKILLPDIGDLFNLDSISVCCSYENSSYKNTVYAWFRGTEDVKDTATDDNNHEDVTKFMRSVEKNEIVVLYDEDMKGYSPEAYAYIQAERYKGIMAVSISSASNYHGYILYSFENEKRRFTERQTLSLNELSKCISTYIEKDYIRNYYSKLSKNV